MDLIAKEFGYDILKVTSIPLYFKSYGDGLESNEKSRTSTKRIYEGAS